MSERIVNQLKNIKHGDTDLHQHLTHLVSTLLLDRSTLANFEAYSSQNRISGGVSPSVFKIREAYSHLKQYEAKHKTLLSKLNTGTEEQPQEPASIGYVPDLQQEAKVFEQFGCGFGEEQSYRIFKSLSRIALKKNAKYVKFWGKIIGSEKDYYIAQGQADAGEEPGELSADTEPKGTGANKWTFWACTELTGDWSELPIITPAQLKVARKIKYIFTGDLSKSVLSNPLFPGKEAHLLKCQLARIHTACAVVPKGSLVLNAESGEIQLPEEYQLPEAAALAKKESWVYPHPSLLKNGRTTLLKPQALEPEEEEKWLKAQSLLDPSQPKLKNVVLDGQKWSIRGVGLEQLFRTSGKNAKTVSRGAIGLKSLVWPGWTTVAYASKTSNIYIGYGHKHKQSYYPFEPEAVLQQKQDPNEYVLPQ